jgi:Flp pilus assembly protein TadD
LVWGCAGPRASSPQHERLNPQEILELRLGIAQELIAQRDFDRALPYLQDLRMRLPTEEPQLRLMLGIVLREKKMYGAALVEMKAAWRLAPNEARIHGVYGVLLDKMQRHVEAEEHHRQAVKLAPRVAQVHNDLGFCLFLQHRLREAETELREAIRLDPTLRCAYNNLGFLLGLRGERQEAFDAFSQAGSQPMALTNMGLVEELRGRPQRARGYYEKALRLRPNYEPALLHLQAIEPQVIGHRALPRDEGPQEPATEE